MSLFGEPLAVPLEAQIAEVDRELAMRTRLYPGWIATKKLPVERAEMQLAAMRGVRRTLQGLLEAVAAHRAEEALANTPQQGETHGEEKPGIPDIPVA
jgi:hypothetical protein